MGLSCKFRVSSPLFLGLLSLAEIADFERTFVIRLVSDGVPTVVKVPLNAVFVNSLGLLLFTFVHVSSVACIFHLLVQTVVIQFGGSVVTQGGGTEVEIGLTKVRGISSVVLAISVLVDCVGLVV